MKPAQAPSSPSTIAQTTRHPLLALVFIAGSAWILLHAQAEPAGPPLPDGLSASTAPVLAASPLYHKLGYLPLTPVPFTPALVPRVRPHVLVAALATSRPAVNPNLSGVVMHPPSVSQATIRAVLVAGQSPTVGIPYADHKDVSRYWWDEGRVLGVDPAVLLALFKHESLYGRLGVARITKSVCNIRPLAGQPNYAGYRRYATWEQGIDACYSLLLAYVRHGADRLDRVLPIFAPLQDSNNDAAYLSDTLQTLSMLYAESVGS